MIAPAKGLIWLQTPPDLAAGWKKKWSRSGKLSAKSTIPGLDWAGTIARSAPSSIRTKVIKPVQTSARYVRDCDEPRSHQPRQWNSLRRNRFAVRHACPIRISGHALVCTKMHQKSRGQKHSKNRPPTYRPTVQHQPQCRRFGFDSPLASSATHWCKSQR